MQDEVDEGAPPPQSAWPPPPAAAAVAAAAAAAQPNHLPALAIGASAAGAIHSRTNGTAVLHACAEGSAEIAKGMKCTAATVTNGSLRRGRLLEPLASLAGLLLVILLTHIQDPATPFFADVVPGP